MGANLRAHDQEPVRTDSTTRTGAAFAAGTARCDHPSVALRVLQLLVATSTVRCTHSPNSLFANFVGFLGSAASRSSDVGGATSRTVPSGVTSTSRSCRTTASRTLLRFSMTSSLGFVFTVRLMLAHDRQMRRITLISAIPSCHVRSVFLKWCAYSYGGMNKGGSDES